MVLALVVGRRERARVQESLRGRARLTFADSLADLRDRVGRIDDVTLMAVVVEPRDRDGAPLSPFVKCFVAASPHVPVIAICDAGTGLSRDLLELAQAGTHEVVIRGVGDDGHTLRTAIESGQRASAGMRTLAHLLPLVPGGLRGMLEFCVYYPAEAKSVAQVATALGVHRKTLTNYCTRAGFPPPSVLVSWCRVLHAAVMLSSTAKPVDQIARLLDFQSGTALRNMFRRHTGLRPSDVRNGVGMALVLGRFRALLPQSLE